MGRPLALVILILPAIFGWLAAAPVRAQDRPPKDLSDRVAALEKLLRSQHEEIEALKAELELRPREAQRAAPAPAGAADPAPAPGPTIAAPVIELARELDQPRPVDISGYFNTRYFNDSRPRSPGRFQAHVVSLFFGKELGKWRFFSEFELEYAPKFAGDGSELSTSRGEILLETAWLNYLHRDWLNSRVGYLLVPTYWRVHHYPSIALTVTNPLIDKRIFPGALTGVSVEGSKYLGEAGFSYALFGGNGRGPDQGRSDVDDHKATGGKFLFHAPTGGVFDVFDAGMISYRDKLSSGERERIYGFESRIEKGRLGFLGEFAHADISPSQSGRAFFREGFYLQPWVRVSRRAHLVYRYDTLNFDSLRPHSRNARQHLFGVNYRPIPTLSLKLEFQRQRSRGRQGSAYNGFAAGAAFFFE